ncbi:MAG: hypothetical protein RTV31_15950 [Candidatus Thorarchaeota archaeon]
MRFNSTNKLRNLILLLVLALFTPAIVGFQYLEWRESNHLFIGITGSIWSILYSDWYPNDWLIILIPNIMVLIPRVLYVLVQIGFDRDRVSLEYVHFFTIMLIVIESCICVSLMITNSIYGVPPGILISIATPDIDIRLFVPTSLLLLVGLYQNLNVGDRLRKK